MIAARLDLSNKNVALSESSHAIRSYVWESRMPIGCAFVCIAHTQNSRLIERPTNYLHANRKSGIGEPARNGKGREAE